MRSSVCIGLVHVRAKTTNQILSTARGAYANALALANDEESFRFEIRAALETLGLDVDEVEDAEPFDVRLSAHSVDLELEDLANQVNVACSVQFGTFHSYRDDRE
jgi:hypothetical protein